MILPTQIPYCFAVFVLFTKSICETSIATTSAQFAKRKVVATSYKTIQSLSKIQCVEKCFEEGRNGMCNVAGYNKRTKECYLSVDSPQDVLDVTDEMAGVFFYEQRLV